MTPSQIMVASKSVIGHGCGEGDGVARVVHFHAAANFRPHLGRVAVEADVPSWGGDTPRIPSRVLDCLTSPIWGLDEDALGILGRHS